MFAEGQSVFKEHDDLMSATRYAVMMLRFADVKDRPELDLGQRERAAASWMSI